MTKPKRKITVGRNQGNIARATRITVSVKHGFLWIGPDEGPCLVHITGKQTLLKIAAMIRRYAE